MIFWSSKLWSSKLVRLAHTNVAQDNKQFMSG